VDGTKATPLYPRKFPPGSGERYQSYGTTCGLPSLTIGLLLRDEADGGGEFLNELWSIKSVGFIQTVYEYEMRGNGRLENITVSEPRWQ